MNTTTSTRASSVTTPESFHFSDDDVEADTPPNDLPNYDLSLPFGSQTKGTDVRFNALRGKIDDEDNEIMKLYFNKLLRIGKHLRDNPQDVEARDDMAIYKELLAKRIAVLRLDADKIGFDQPCLRLLDTIEKEAKIGNNMKKKAKQRAVDRRKRMMLTTVM